MTKILLQPTIKSIDDYIKFCIDIKLDFGFEIVDFAFPSNYGAIAESIKTNYKKKYLQSRKLVSLHGLFIDLYIHSGDPQIGRIAENKYIWNLTIADELKLDYTIFHTNSIFHIKSKRYHLNWIKSHQNFTKKIIPLYDTGILFENMWDSVPLNLAALMELTSKDRINVCFDTGHFNIFSEVDLETWFKALGPRIKYIHINDNQGKIDQELPPGRGNIHWKNFHELVTSYTNNPIVVLEVSDLNAVKESIDYLRNNEIYPLA